MASLDIQNNADSVRLKNVKRNSKIADTPHIPFTNNNVTPRTTQAGFIARLHAFLPPNFTSSSIQSSPEVVKDSQPKYLKTQIISWNMHDSLPKGNLEDLLGIVPPYSPRTFRSDIDRLALPSLSMDEGHPYHIVVIAGQECPTLSGIPMGLAANFKYKDHRDKEKHKDANLDDMEKHKRKDRNIIHRAESLIHKHMKHEHNDHAKTSESSSDEESSSSAHTTTTSGWSAVIEDWFANGIGSMQGLKPVVTTIPQECNTGISPLPADKGPGQEKKQNTIDVNWRMDSVRDGHHGISTSSTNVKKGPYELLAKERLMGIYMAIYVHRDVRPLIRGISSDTVPAGLIGGRLGNKGGVGISVNFSGTTFLFINAHLAAHEEKVQLRVANLNKIKNELYVDSFLSADDPRMVSEDLTDKFDHTFIFGDLNFRLDISRLHADWLISRKEYSKALGFDQLKHLMKNDPAFSGLYEGNINFPPTFKYDVSRRKSKSNKKNRKPEEGRDGNPGEREDLEAQDSISIRSSLRPSVHSKRSIDDLEIVPTKDKSSKRFVANAVLKAKTAWTALIYPKQHKRLSTQSSRHRKENNFSTSGRGKGPSTQSLNNKRRPPDPAFLSTPALSSRTTTLQEVALQIGEDELSESEKGVYDSSAKQRVPSWCDRILWKTTVKAPDEAEDILPSEPNPQRPRRISQAFSIPRRNKNEPPRKSLGLFKTLSLESSASVPQLSGEAASGSDTPLQKLHGGVEVRRQKSLPGSPQSSRQWLSRLPRRADTGGSDQSATAQDTNESANSNWPIRWRWPFSMMSREPLLPSNTPIAQSRHRKGDVVVIKYRTLDDRQMKRLEGRSDHRPVIGSYSIHI